MQKKQIWKILQNAQYLRTGSMPLNIGFLLILFSGTYFLCMIAMVCVSVLSTGFVMHVSSLSQSMPRWVEHVFLEIIPRRLCLTTGPRYYNDREEVMTVPNQLQYDDVAKNGKETKMKNNQVEAPPDTPGFNEAIALLRSIKDNLDIRHKDDDLTQLQWKRLSVVIDRILLCVFTLFTVLCTLILSIQIIDGSKAEYDAILRELDEQWS